MSKVILRPVLSAVLAVTVLNCPSSLLAQNDGAATFKKNCTLCHGADGTGNTPTGKALQAKDLKVADVQKQSDDALAGVITNGHGKMPAFGAKLTPETIKSLVAYIRDLP
jgi:mono/diheme cytochrome c family protein